MTTVQFTLVFALIFVTARADGQEPMLPQPPELPPVVLDQIVKKKLAEDSAGSERFKELMAWVREILMAVMVAGGGAAALRKGYQVAHTRSQVTRGESQASANPEPQGTLASKAQAVADQPGLADFPDAPAPLEAETVTRSRRGS